MCTVVASEEASAGGQHASLGVAPVSEPAVKIPLDPAPKLPAWLLLPQLPAAILAGRRPPARPLAPSASDEAASLAAGNEMRLPVLQALEAPTVDVGNSSVSDMAPAAAAPIAAIALGTSVSARAWPPTKEQTASSPATQPTTMAASEQARVAAPIQSVCQPQSVPTPLKVVSEAPYQPPAAALLAGQRLRELLGGGASAATIDQLVMSGRASVPVLTALTALADQAVRMGIDYARLGLGWDHPTTRMQYRRAQHPSTLAAASRRRGFESSERIVGMMSLVASGDVVGEDAIRRLFVEEIGLPAESSAGLAATFEGVAAALEAELLLPLRALYEGQSSMHRTYSGDPVPPAKIAEVVQALLGSVLCHPSGFTSWRYGCPLGLRQLEGLTEQQVRLWREPSSLNHAGGLRTHEDAEFELGLFWATKIGGPSHGFDFEAQCLLPLLCNARHKVVLVSDPAYPSHPCGRAHWRLLWTASADGRPAPSPEPRLWLEAVHIDFEAARVVDMNPYVSIVLRHAIAKSESMEVPVLIDAKLTEETNQLAHHIGTGGRVYHTQERLMLHPSNGVCEASDFLSRRHDWVQLQPEVTMPIYRALYVPSALREVFAGRAAASAAAAAAAAA